jgi:hypothetical protein
MVLRGLVYAGTGDDFAFAQRACGGDGNDRIIGRRLHGGRGSDEVEGYAPVPGRNHLLFGGPGNDQLDTPGRLYGGPGDDELT